MKRTACLVCLISISYSLLYSETKSENEIREVAKNFLAYYQAFAAPVAESSQNVKTVQPLFDRAGTETVGFVAIIEPKGFIILSTTQELPPVLAYSFRQEWNADTSSANEFYQLLTTDLKMRKQARSDLSPEEIAHNQSLWQSYLKSQDAALSRFAFRQWPAPGVTATGGWVETTWHQYSPYNNFCPVDAQTSARSLVGCVATALAQIINYHRWLGDAAFDDSDAYSTATRGIIIDADSTQCGFPSFNRLNGYLTNLQQTYLDGAPLANEDLAALSFASAVSVKMDFTSDVSGADMAAVIPSVLDKFRFNSAQLTPNLADETATAHFFYRLQENMMNGEPAILEIGWTAFFNLHAVVCDGFNSDGFYHLNFGWGSGSPAVITDAWYLLPDGMPAGYEFVLSAVTDIRPVAAPAPVLTCTTDELYLDASPVNEASPLSSFVLSNGSAQTITIEYIVASENFLVGVSPSSLADSIGVLLLPPTSELTLYAQCNPDSVGPFEGQAIIFSSAGNPFLNVHLRGFGVPTGGTIINTLSGNWGKSGSPYYLYRSVAATGARLDIQAGAEIVAFEHSSMTIGPGVRLRAIGAETDSIRFRAWDRNKGWGGIKISGSGADDQLSYCVISDCKNPWNGGGLFIQNASPIIEHTRISNNQATYGAGLYCEAATPIIQFCVVEGNHASEIGGAFYLVDSAPRISNTLIYQNQAETNSAFLYCHRSSPTFTNITLHNNIDGQYVGGLIYLAADTHPTFINSVLWSTFGDGNLNIFMEERNTLEFHYSDIYTSHLYQDWGIVGLPFQQNEIIWGEGNLAAPPRLISENNKVYVPRDGVSPCIDGGDPSALYFDRADPQNPGFARWPAKGTLRNDLGAYGGPWTDIPVPVELTTFTADVKAREVVLLWTTATESNNYGFEVERREGDDAFARIGFVRGNGTTTQPHSYSFVDKNSKPGRYSYRLRQIDTDGALHFSPTIDVVILPPQRFTLSQNYPNPFNANTKIEYALPEKSHVQIILYNIRGEKIKTLVAEEQEAGHHTVAWDGADERGRVVSSGVYIFKMTAGGFSDCKKLLLLR